ncbi:MAG: molecular chaperone [Ferruginibacter sp.]|nr:molecular chaperone [Chitinophagaceae bacterium]
MKKSHSGFFYLAFCALSILHSSTSMAQGDLMIYPKRIVFEGAKRSQEINLANSGKDTARYMLSVVQIRMKEDGSFEQIAEPDPGQSFADKYFRIFPRNVVLGPNEAQTVKIQLTNTGELQAGEYRSHLYIRAEAEKTPLGEKEHPIDSTTISVKLVAVFGISIPVIIRSGENTAEISLSDISFQQPKDTLPSVKFTFNRSGNMSVYGDIAVDYISPEGKTTRVGLARGLAVYTPTTKRFFNLALNQVAGVDYHKGSLHLSYSYDATKNEKLVEEKISLR